MVTLSSLYLLNWACYKIEATVPWATVSPPTPHLPWVSSSNLVFLFFSAPWGNSFLVTPGKSKSCPKGLLTPGGCVLGGRPTARLLVPSFSFVGPCCFWSSVSIPLVFALPPLHSHGSQLFSHSSQLHHRPVLGFRMDPYVYNPSPGETDLSSHQHLPPVLWGYHQRLL